jgi:hypothetical protein
MAIAYYSLIVLIYFNQEIREIISGKAILNKGLFSRQLSEKNKNTSPNVQSVTDSLLPENREKCNSIALNALQDEINAYFLQSAIKAADKDKVISDLSQRLGKYPNTKNDKHKDILKKIILWSCENNCAVALSDEDLERVWKG